MPLNACELEIDLFCRGLRVPEAVPLDGARGISRTRAGLGSGLEITIPTGSWLKERLWVNVPVEESFVRDSPYVLEGAPADGYRVADERTGHRYAITIPSEPAWYSRATSRGIPMNRIGVLQGTYLGIYVNMVCTFWNYSPALNCRFCTTGNNVGEHEVVDKAVSDVVEVARAARDESGVTFVHLNAGFQGSRGVQFAEPYIAALKELGVLVGAQLAPEKDFSRYDRLIGHGRRSHLVLPRVRRSRVVREDLPGQGEGARAADLLRFDRLLRQADEPRGRVGRDHRRRRAARGDDEGDRLDCGPGRVSDRLHLPPDGRRRHGAVAVAAYEDMRRVMAHVYDACRRNWIPIGAAPNIEVSIVVNPDDAALLAPRSAGFYAYEAYRRAARVAARPLFARRMRPRPRRESGDAGEIPPATGAGGRQSFRVNQLIIWEFPVSDGWHHACVPL